MFDYLQGILISLEPNFIVLDNQGIGYKIFITESWFTELKVVVNSKIQVFVTLVVKEMEQVLYGFRDKDLRNYFNVLISMSGIGPKIGMSILSLFSCVDILKAVQQKNAVIFSSVSGIGKKTAEKLILDLEGKLPPISTDFSLKARCINFSYFDDAMAALIQLGYSRTIAEKLLQEAFKRLPQDADLSMILKEALRKY